MIRFELGTLKFLSTAVLLGMALASSLAMADDGIPWAAKNLFGRFLACKPDQSQSSAPATKVVEIEIFLSQDPAEAQALSQEQPSKGIIVNTIASNTAGALPGKTASLTNLKLDRSAGTLTIAPVTSQFGTLAISFEDLKNGVPTAAAKLVMPDVAVLPLKCTTVVAQ